MQNAISPKVMAASFGSAVATLLLSLLSLSNSLPRSISPKAVAGVTVATTTFLAFIFGYMRGYMRKDPARAGLADLAQGNLAQGNLAQGNFAQGAGSAINAHRGNESTMIATIDVATVFVSDLDAALDFYTNKLEFEVLKNTDNAGRRHIEVAPSTKGPFALELVDREVYGYPATCMGRFTGITFGTSDIQRTYATLKQVGVHFEYAPRRWERDDFVVHAARFSDEDGNEFDLVQATGPSGDPIPIDQWGMVPRRHASG